jgi:hypothetical protein
MAPKKCSTIATRPATAPWNVAKKPQLEANIHRMNELKARYAAVSKALKPALLEIANRTAGELQNDTRYHQTSANKRQFDQVQSELKGALDRGVSSISAVTKIKMAAVQRKTEYDMWLVEQECKVNPPKSIANSVADTPCRRRLSQFGSATRSKSKRI